MSKAAGQTAAEEGGYWRALCDSSLRNERPTPRYASLASKSCFLLLGLRQTGRRKTKKHSSSKEALLRQARLSCGTDRIRRNKHFTARAPLNPQLSYRASDAPCRGNDRLLGGNLDVAAAVAIAVSAATAAATVAAVRLRRRVAALLSQRVVARRRHRQPAHVELELGRGLGRVADLELQNERLTGSSRGDGDDDDGETVRVHKPNGFRHSEPPEQRGAKRPVVFLRA